MCLKCICSDLGRFRGVKMAPKRTKKVQILTEFYDLTPWGRQGGPLGSPPQKKIIKILKAAFWFSVKALADSAALSLYTPIRPPTRVLYIYKIYKKYPQHFWPIPESSTSRQGCNCCEKLFIAGYMNLGRCDLLLFSKVQMPLVMNLVTNSVWEGGTNAPKQAKIAEFDPKFGVLDPRGEHRTSRSDAMCSFYSMTLII